MGHLVHIATPFRTGKMSLFCAIFEVNRSIGKLTDLKEHFGKKDTVDFQ